MAKAPLPEYISRAKAAELIGVTPRTLDNMIRDGRLTGYRLGPRTVRLNRAEVEAALVPFGGAV
jgi:excisionase family DNA binding protein